MIVATGSHPASVATESFEVMAHDLFKHGSHITHVVEGLQLLDSQSFLLLAKLHSLQERLAVLFPFLVGQGAYLVGIVTAHNVQ